MSAKGKGTARKDESQWVFLMNGTILDHAGDADGKPAMCKLRHPKTDAGSMYLFSCKDKSVYEITKFSAPCRSWFIGQTVQHDGGIYITSQMDATYLALPYLIQAEKGGKYQMLDQVITDADFPECNRLCCCLSEDDMIHIADVKGSGDFKAYRYSKEKTLNWLKRKVDQVADKLEKENINVSGGSLSHVFVRSTKTANSSREDYIRYAHGMISEYIPLEVSQNLRAFLGIKDVKPPKHEKPDVVEPSSKKARTEQVQATEDYSQFGIAKEESTKGPKTNAQNKLSKVDKKGMKSISSFFVPKGKK